MDKRDFMRQEFIGLDIEVVESSCPEHLLRGKVVDETKNMLAISCQGRERWIPKSDHEFEFTYQGERIRVLGSEIQHRPEDRIKRIR
jgi:ribonuclease P protein subunit POP4